MHRADSSIIRSSWRAGGPKSWDGFRWTARASRLSFEGYETHRHGPDATRPGIRHLRLYIKYAADYDQGNLNHTGGSLAAVAGTDRWAGMGSAGIRPRGDDRFNSRFEPWCDWRKLPPPGYLFLYTYWMEMARDRDGHYWGNMLGPVDSERVVPRRGQWHCLEHMIKANDVGQSNGELAAWIDGKLLSTTKEEVMFKAKPASTTVKVRPLKKLKDMAGYRSHNRGLPNCRAVSQMRRRWNPPNPPFRVNRPCSPGRRNLARRWAKTER